MNLSGNIRKRQTKRGYAYQLSVNLPTVDGKRQRKYVTLPMGTTKKTAEKKLREMIAECEEGSYLRKNDMSVATWMKKFEELYMDAAGLSPTTVVRYKCTIKNYIIPHLGDILIQNLTPIKIQEWVNSMSQKSPCTGKALAPKTVSNHFLCFRRALDMAVDMGVLTKNPAQRITLPKRQKYKCKVYDEGQIRQLLESVKGTELELVVELELAVGLRRGELLGLTYDNLDFVNNTLTVAQNLVVVNGNKHLKEPKTEAGKRTIPINKQLMAKLAKQQIHYKECKLKYGQAFEDSGLVFCKANGKAHDPNKFSRKFREHLERHGLEHMRFHDLRHLCASIYLDNSVSPKVISQILGHSDISTTLSIYSHVMEKSNQEAVEKMENYLYGSG